MYILGEWETPPKRTIELDDAKKIKSLRDLIFLAQFKFWDAKWQVKASAYENKSREKQSVSQTIDLVVTIISS